MAVTDPWLESSMYKARVVEGPQPPQPPPMNEIVEARTAFSSLQSSLSQAYARRAELLLEYERACNDIEELVRRIASLVPNADADPVS